MGLSVRRGNTAIDRVRGSRCAARMHRVPPWASLLLIAACSPRATSPREARGPEPDVTAPAPTKSEEHPGVPEADGGDVPGGTRYRVGDFVEYRYSGSFSPDPVVLREKITEQNDNHLAIEVHATRGADERGWIQWVTDTPENQKNNVVDKLVELGADGARTELANKSNADLIDLYSWTLPPCDGPPKVGDKSSRSLEIASARYECTCEAATIVCSGHDYRMETCECPEFLWTHATGVIQSTEDDSVLWRVDVTDAGRAP